MISADILALIMHNDANLIEAGEEKNKPPRIVCSLARFYLKVFLNSEILTINRRYSRRWKLSRESKFIGIDFFVSSYRPPSSYSIRVGDHNRQLNEGTEETVQGKEVISHPEYNKPSLINNDIALIRLVRPVKLGPRVGTVCLPAQGETVPVSATCYITGMKTVSA